ncbi:hypothetical protein AUJ84_01110 [Candidatus Pacearchaeota archaeon CG1_02_32_132]|nr:MAG: hypothetical protein AUJ84_01110 [Candidatus Pacearchaeota archaeon CG1_02_32_132]
MSTEDVIRSVLSKRNYLIGFLVTSGVLFSLFYYLLVVKVADKDIWISVMMSGTAFVTTSVFSIVLLSILTGILLMMILYKYNLYNSVEGKGFFGFIGAGIGAFGVGCPTCGAFLFGLIGMPLALTYLPFRGLELQFVSIIILGISIYLTGKSIDGMCKVKL